MKIWVDDDFENRRPPGSGWLWFLNSKDCILALEWFRSQNETIELMSLDHDLGGDDTTRPIVLWCCENDFWPVETVVHSANPVGVEWLEGMIERYGPQDEHSTM